MKLFARSIILIFVFAGFAPLAFGQTYSAWTNVGGDTSFETGSNWTTATGTGTVPGSNNIVAIFPGFTTQPDPTQSFILVTQGGPTTITIVAGASHSLDALLISGNFDSTTISGGGILNLNFGTNTLTVGPLGTAVVGGTTVNYTGNLNIASGSLQVGSTNNSIDPSQTTGAGIFNLISGTATIHELQLGDSGSTGTFMQTGATTSTVQTGILALNSGSYTIGGTGTNNLTLTGGGSVEMASSGNFTFTQNDANSTVDASAAGTLTQMGLTSGNTAFYQLQSGTFKADNITLGATSGATGTINQSGGTFISTGSVQVGSTAGGTGSYILSGGSADFQSGFTVGDSVGSTITQSGSAILTSEGASSVGVSSTGSYSLSGGSATFSDGLTVGPTGQFNQSGGTFSLGAGVSSLIINAGGSVTQTGGTLTVDPTLMQTLDLSAVGSSYTLGGTGILQVGNGTLAGTTGEGVLKLAGGTLQVIGTGAFTDPIDSTLTGVSTIDAVTTTGVTSVTLGGNLSGAGGITFAGGASTMFQFSGTNTYTGPTTITSGILNATAANITNSSALNMGAAGTLNLTLANGGFAYAGALGGSGALNINFAMAGNPFVVLNTSNYTGPITLGANGTRGNLQVYGGTYGNIGQGAALSGVTIGGTPLAAFPAGVTAPSSGVVTLLGTNTYTGLTTVNSGFTLDANTLGGALTLNSGTVGLVPTTAVGSTLNINGALTSTGGVLAIRANGSIATPVADLILTTGAATIDSASGFQITGVGKITTPIPILTASGGLTVNPAALLNVNSSLLFLPTLTVNGNSIDLTAIQTPVASFAITPNEMAVAVPVDQATTNSALLPPSQQAALNNVLLGFNKFTSAAQVAAGLEELTPESLQYARNIAFENSNFLANRMNSVDADLRAGYGGLDTNAISVVTPGFDSGLGRSLGSLLAYDDPSFHQPAPNGVNYYPGGGDSTSPSSSSASTPSSAPAFDSSSQVISDTPNPYLANQHPSGPDAPNMNVFIGGDVVLADLNQNQSTTNSPSSKASYAAADATAGISFRMTSHLAAGVLFDYNHTDAKTDSSGSKTDVDSYSPGLFATYFDHGFYANGLFSFGYNNYSNTRDISFLNQTATSKPSGQQYVGDLDFGYDFHPDKNWVWGPTLGVTYTHLDIDSFTETGAPGADLAVDSQSADSLRSRLGGHVVFQTNTGDVLLQPNLTAMWQHEYLDSSSGITSSFSDFSSSSFTTQTAAPSRDSALVGVGLTATLNNSMALFLNYLADVGAGDYFAQSVVGGFKARF